MLMYLPTVSRLVDTGMTPTWETDPCEGRNPKTPQKLAGILTSPTVSIPAIYKSMSTSEDKYN